MEQKSKSELELMTNSGQNSGVAVSLLPRPWSEIELVQSKLAAFEKPYSLLETAPGLPVAALHPRPALRRGGRKLPQEVHRSAPRVSRLQSRLTQVRPL